MRFSSSPLSCFLKMQFVQIPGYAEAQRLEYDSRQSAFDESQQSICGIVVMPLTLRKESLLRRERNGFFVRCEFESDNEAHAHARQVAWFCSPEFFYPSTKLDGLKYTWRQARWLTQVNRIRPDVFTREVLRFANDSYYDSPFHGAKRDEAESVNSVPAQAIATDIVYIADMFARSGYSFSLGEILDMPLKQLWQFVRVIYKREGINLPNRSTVLAAKYLHEMQGGKK